MDDMTALLDQVAQSMCAGVSCLDRDLTAMRMRSLLKMYSAAKPVSPGHTQVTDISATKNPKRKDGDQCGEIWIRSKDHGKAVARGAAKAPGR